MMRVHRTRRQVDGPTQLECIRRRAFDDEGGMPGSKGQDEAGREGC
jgi:hypothetical protein